ncbi:PAS domain S-box protein [Sphingomonas sp. A2-49]|uniref:PAS domain S-box protein n=1 Tax=Sphingomonas sp. A2-49 TaxID=1391375 RepID=UPI0021D0F9E8|nr:PAS domain S-box protein [Sphingomonas sp. A2-49]MCU6454691.1 PAS domain S-box protein [Sphingomonas sp. A2-49]
MNEIPVLSERRKAALAHYDILDTPREPAFDEIASLAAALCGTPIAVVNFVADDRQFFKAEVGLGVRETPLETSFCVHALLGDNMLIVPDMRADPRFAGNPLVAGEAPLLFYAGALLKTPEGVPIGTLCVLDRRPRTIDPVQQQALTVLARQVVTTLQLRRAAAVAAAEHARHRAIVDSASDFAIVVTALDGTITDWSAGAATIFGRAGDAMVGQPVATIFTAEDRAAGVPDREMAIALREGRADDERWLERGDGSRFWASGEMSPLRDPGGRPVGFVKMLRDRTGQHRTIQALSRAQTQLRWAQEAGGVGVFEVGSDGMLHGTPEFARLYGVDAAEGVPAALFERLIVAEDRHLVSDLASRAAGTAPLDVEYRIRRADDGALRWIARRGQIFRDADGRPVRFAGVALDITDRRQASAAIAAAEERYSTVMAAIDVGFCVIELKFDDHGTPVDYRLVEGNPAFERQTGLTGAIGRWVSEVAPGLEPHWFERYGRVAATGEPAHFENAAEALGRWYDVRALRIGAPEDRRVAVFFSDISDRKAMEDRLRDLNATLADQVEARTQDRDRMWRLSSDVMLVVGFDARIEAVNPAWTDLLGWAAEDLVGSDMLTLVHPDDVVATRAEMDGLQAGVRTLRFENRYRHRDGHYLWLSWTAVPDDRFVHAVGRDITGEREQAAALARTEDALRQAQKMEAVGQLTGGIAHDFNNMLTGVIGGLDLIERNLAMNRMDRVARYIDAATTSAQRAAALTARLLAFGRRQSLDLQPTDVNALVGGMEDLLGRTLGEQIALETRPATPLWSARTDANQLESALLNLCINARDAMPDGGTLTIETANVAVDGGHADDHATVAPGDYVVLSVADTGIGMSDATLAKVFEPFFTTKPVGQGTGLGLSMVYGFARQSGGHVRIDSAVGRGTVVRLYVPRFHGEAARVAEVRPAAPVGAGETVMIVEDDSAVRLIILDVLAELGYQAIEAVDARSAIPILESGRPIDLLVTDVGLPGLNGRQLADIARRSRPDLRILFVTGYAQNATVRAGFLDEGMEMMTKPFAVDALATRIRQMLTR